MAVQGQLWLKRPATAVPAGSGRGRWPHKARLVPGASVPQVDHLAAVVSYGRIARLPDQRERPRASGGRIRLPKIHTPKLLNVH
jgi:hypothetical protein